VLTSLRGKDLLGMARVLTTYSGTRYPPWAVGRMGLFDGSDNGQMTVTT